MKNYLYLDSSHFVQVGVLDENFTWKHVELVENKKGSTILHKTIYEILRLLELKLKNIDALFLVSGPGSYTGIRLAEGIAQVLEMNEIPIYSFYHYEVPSWCGFESYNFYSNAFKNEFFDFSYNKGIEEKKMMSKESFFNIDFSRKDLFSITGELEEKYLESTSSLIENNSKEVFKKVMARGKHIAPYYYRPLEKEFKPSVKI